VSEGGVGMMMNYSLAKMHGSPLTLVGEGVGERGSLAQLGAHRLPGVARRLVTKTLIVGWANCPPFVKLPRGHRVPTLQHQREGGRYYEE
jgi:hypothetical protein